ncbi:MAG: (2Fe-2S) ferredoxin domain-containing protein [Patescibacteria group bacterium]
MSNFKNIAVCHGKSCGPKGASRIKKILEQCNTFKSIKIQERECCGRCEHSCTIVIDDQAISDLSPDTLQKAFLDNPSQALAEAHKKDMQASKDLDRILSDDGLL